MDSIRFDEMTKALAEGTTRRTVLRSAAGGGLAALLAALGLGAVGPEEAAAHRRRRCNTPKCRRHRRKHRTENNQSFGVTIFNEGDQSVQHLLATGATLVGATCDGTQATAGLCRSGYCNTGDNTCQACPESRVCGEDDDNDGLVCCVDGYVCADLGCVADGTL